MASDQSRVGSRRARAGVDHAVRGSTTSRRRPSTMPAKTGKGRAREAPVAQRRYTRHWRERLGHSVMCEALPAAREATRLLLDAACEWLAGEGTEAARGLRHARVPVRDRCLRRAPAALRAPQPGV